MGGIRSRDFREVRKNYRIIEQDSVNVVVAYDRDRYEELAEEARRKRLSREWVMRARPYAVNCFRGNIPAMVQPVSMKDGTPSDDWYLYLFHKHYDAKTGLQIPEKMEFLGA